MRPLSCPVKRLSADHRRGEGKGEEAVRLFHTIIFNNDFQRYTLCPPKGPCARVCTTALVRHTLWALYIEWSLIAEQRVGIRLTVKTASSHRGSLTDRAALMS